MKKKELELDIGDLVVYPTYGVGEIEDFDSYNVDGASQDFILINFKQDKMKLRIPKDKASSSGLRKLSNIPIKTYFGNFFRNFSGYFFDFPHEF